VCERSLSPLQYKPQWIKKGSAQSGEGTNGSSLSLSHQRHPVTLTHARTHTQIAGYGSQLRLIDYLGADKSLMNRFGYKG
jgi:hypothetical protein